MDNKIVRLGIVGTGPRLRKLMMLYKQHPNCKIVSLCDRAKQVVEKAAATLGDPDVKCYTSYEEMLKGEPLDALLIGINPDTQVDIACDAMHRGLHVTTEVPAAYTIKQCRDLVNAVEKTGVKYQLSEQTRYWGFISAWREMARNNEFGQILFMEGEYLHYEEKWDLFVDPANGELFYGSIPPVGRVVEPTWRSTTFKHPILYLPHELSPLLSIIDDRVTRVSCIGTRPLSYSTEEFQGRDMEIALMHTSKDTVLKVSAGFTSPHGHRGETSAHWYQVMGTKRTVEWKRTDDDKPKMWNADDKKWRDMDWTTAKEDAEEYVKASGHGGADWWPVNTFVRSILDDTSVGMDVYKAVESAAPAILAAESSEKGGILLEVPDFRKK